MSQKLIFAGLLVAAVFLAFYNPSQVSTEAEILQSFNSWIKLHSKQYRSEEEKLLRFNTYRSNYFLVQEHNKRYAQGLESYDLELNLFADLESKQFGALYTSGLKRKGATTACTGSVANVPNPPASIDWTTVANVVNQIKNQGQCGSCWAFSAVGALEGLHGLEKGTLISLSEQQLVDCATGTYGNEGCNGGYMDSAIWYVIDNGIATEASYPYKGKDQTCTYKSTQEAYRVKNCAEVPANKTAWLVNAINAGPVSVAVQANQIGFQLYKQGVFSGNCGTNLDHGIVAVGYGNQGGKDFWKVRNSWGTTWGMSGYMLMIKGADGPGQCGILMQDVIPLESV